MGGSSTTSGKGTFFYSTAAAMCHSTFGFPWSQEMPCHLLVFKPLEFRSQFVTFKTLKRGLIFRSLIPLGFIIDLSTASAKKAERNLDKLGFKIQGVANKKCNWTRRLIIVRIKKVVQKRPTLFKQLTHHWTDCLIDLARWYTHDFLRFFLCLCTLPFIGKSQDAAALVAVSAVTKIPFVKSLYELWLLLSEAIDKTEELLKKKKSESASTKASLGYDNAQWKINKKGLRNSKSQPLTFKHGFRNWRSRWARRRP